MGDFLWLESASISSAIGNPFFQKLRVWSLHHGNVQELWYDGGGGRGWIFRTRTLPPLSCVYRQCIDHIFAGLCQVSTMIQYKIQNARGLVY